MLKIKDSVDLKELEKFGFVKSKNAYLPRYRRNYVEIFCDLPKEWCNDEVDKSRIKQGLSIIHERSIHFEEDVPEFYKDSLIYDLITADMVEKVEE